jgi:hypothetical protein
MGKEYIRLRGENNLYCIVKHEDVLHTHLHITVSGTQLNGQSSRISKKEFADIKLGMDLFQNTHFPNLVNSLPDHGRVDKEKISSAESQKIKRPERTIDKNILVGLLETTYAKATSVEQFLSAIKANGHEPYFRNGRLQGILYEGERKFRLKPLGYDTEKLQALDLQKNKEEKSLNELDKLRTSRGKETVRNISDSIDEKETTNVSSKKEETALQEIEDIRNGKNGRELDMDLDDDSSESTEALDDSEDGDEKDIDNDERDIEDDDTKMDDDQDSDDD